MLSYYPLLLKPITKAKVWGGRNLERLLSKRLPPKQMIGETWEAWDGCEIENGEHRGKTLAQVIEQDAEGIKGTAKGTEGKRFPLLFKYIDAQDDLSVQVHPNDAQARTLENYPFGKTEAWYILDAAPGARLWLGFNANVGAAQIAAAIEKQTLVALLAPVPVQRGDVIFTPAGTVHAIGKGIVLAEIQQNSDVTYRLYDWGRVGRELHVEKGLRVSRMTRVVAAKIAPLEIKGAACDRRFLAACRYFSFELVAVRARVDETTRDQFHILSLIEGGVRIHFGREVVFAKHGQTVVLPARLGAYAIAPMDAPARFLQMYVPDLKRDVVEPLKKVGFSAAEIARLGGSDPNLNDLQ